MLDEYKMDETLGTMSEYSRSYHAHANRVKPAVYERERPTILPNDYDHFHLDKSRTIEFSDEPKWRSATKAYEEAIREMDQTDEQVFVRKSTTLDNKKPFKGERYIQRYPCETQPPKDGFTLMKTTGTCMTNRDEPEEEEVCNYTKSTLLTKLIQEDFTPRADSVIIMRDADTQTTPPPPQRPRSTYYSMRRPFYN